MGDEPGSIPAATTTPAATTAPAADPNDLSKPENFEKLDPHVKSYVQKLKQDKQAANDEAAARRGELRETQAERDALKASQKAAEEAKLVEENRFKELYEAEKAEKTKLATESNKRLTKAEVKSLAQAEGAISAKIVDLIPIDSITVDASGNIVGVAEAVAKFKTENPEFFKDASVATPLVATTPAVKPTGSSVGEPGAATKPQIKNARDMTKAEYVEYKREQMAKMSKR